MLVRNFSLFLLAAGAQAAVSFLMLPLTTYVLAAEDFGAFALMTSLAGIGSMVAAMGSSYTLSAHFSGLQRAARTGLVSANLGLGLIVCVTYAAVLTGAWPVLGPMLNVSSVPPGALALMLATMVLSFPWILAADVTVLEGHSATFASVTAIQAAAVASSTLMGLYVWDLGLLALFVGAFVGALVQLVGALLVLRPYLGTAEVSTWTRQILKIGPLASLGGFAESFQSVSERSILSAQAGLAQLGLYTHSQQYRQVLFVVVKSVTRSIWPVTLEESRQEGIRFERTGKAWTGVHIALTMVGVLVAAVGNEFIALLTHDKFTAAAPLVALWIVVLLVKHSGRAELGFLYAHHHSGYVATLTLVTIGLSIPAMVLLVPRWGMMGALAALLVQDLVFRAGLTVRARRLAIIPFQDGWVLKGSLLIGVALVGFGAFDPGLLQKLVVVIPLEALLAWIAYSMLLRLPPVPSLVAEHQ